MNAVVQVVFAYTFDETGQYTLGVDDIVSDVTVEEDASEDSATDDAPADSETDDALEDSATDDAPEEDDELADADDDGAGLGVGVALLALAVFAAVILRTHLVVRFRPER